MKEDVKDSLNAYFVQAAQLAEEKEDDDDDEEEEVEPVKSMP